MSAALSARLVTNIGFRFTGVHRPRCLISSPGSSPTTTTIRGLNSNRAVVARVRRDVVAKTYPTLLVMPDGATIVVRYPVPREIIKAPIDVNACSPEDIKRIRHLRRPRGKIEVAEEITTTFDPMKYVQK